MIVSAADVRVYDQILRLAFYGKVVDCQEQLFYSVETKLAESAVTRYVDVAYDCAPCAVVELYVAAACVVKLFNYFSVALCDVIDQLFVRGVELSGSLEVRRNYHLLEELRRSGDSLLCDCVLVFQSFYEFIVIYKGMMIYGNLPRQVCVVDKRGFAVECDSAFCFMMLDAVKAPHEVEMPCRAAEFAVSDYVISGFFLLLDEREYFFILYGFKLRLRNLTCFEIGSCFFEIFWAKEAAYVVVTEGCL